MTDSYFAKWQEAIEYQERIDASLDGLLPAKTPEGAELWLDGRVKMLVELCREQKDRLAKLQHDAHLFGVLRRLLTEHGCPWPDPCHVPTVVGDWLGKVTPKGGR